MKVQDIQKNKQITDDAFSPVSTLAFVLGLFGLCCIKRDGRKLKYSWPIFKIIFWTILLLTLTSLNIFFNMKLNDGKNVRFQDYIPIIYLIGYLQFIVDLIYVYKYGRQRCLDYYMIFQYVDDILRLPYHKEIKWSVTKMAMVYICLASLTIGTDFCALTIGYGWIVTAIHSVDYLYIVFKMLTAIDAITQYTQIQYRLKRFEDILEDYYCNAGTLPGVNKNIIDNKDWTKTKLYRWDSLGAAGNNCEILISQLNSCYLLLLEQCDYLNGIFGFRNLFGALSYLMEMVMLMNLVIRLITGTLIPYNSSAVLPAISTTMKILCSSLVLLCEINRCEQNYKQLDKIVRLIDQLQTNKKMTMDVHESLKELRELIITRPVNFNAMNFYRLDYPGLLSMASAIVTYTIILLQNMK